MTPDEPRHDADARTPRSEAPLDSQPTEAIDRTLPITRELPTITGPADASSSRPRSSMPPSVPPVSRAQPPASQPAEPGAPATRGDRIPRAAVIGAAAAAVILLAVTLGSATLMGGRGSTASSLPTTSASSSTTPSPSTRASASGTPAPSATSTIATRLVVGEDSPPGDDGACTAEIRKEHVKDGEFQFDVRVKATAGGVETWEVRIGLGEATADEVDGATLAQQADGVLIVTSDDGAKRLDSGKRLTFKVSGTGEPQEMGISCSS